jgi:DNA-binding NarL/FixJ family response regulator
MEVRTLRQPVSVLLVEDNALIALDVRETLQEAGFDLVGPFSTYAAALNALERFEPEFCVLDLELDGTRSTPFGPGEEGRRLLTILNSRKVATVVYSGHANRQPAIRELHSNVVLVDKLETPARVVAALKALRDKRAAT